ncbi:MAG: hydroxyacid dehydrogenase [Rhodobacteraceae bacterium]|nr:hydroxyacid dehydrogenase [Paracoccaceae bacterium]
MTASPGMVLITGWPLLPPAEAHLGDAGFTIVQSSPNPGQAELIALLAENRPVGLVVRSGIIDRACFDAAPDLKVIASHGAGYDDIDVAEATRRGIPVFAAPGRNAVSVAEHVFALLLAVRKRTLHHDKLVRSGDWRPAVPQTAELSGRTMGIVGFGAIGERVAALAAAFGMRVVAVDPERTCPFPRQIVQSATLGGLLEESDVVSLHVPLTDATRNMIDAAALAHMKQGAILINAARGGIVDEEALVDAIDSGHLFGAGLDTFAEEPPGESSVVAHCDGIVLSPHIAGVTPESAQRMSMCCAENVVQFLVDGTCSDDLVNDSWDVLRRI